MLSAIRRQAGRTRREERERGWDVGRLHV